MNTETKTTASESVNADAIFNKLGNLVMKMGIITPEMLKAADELIDILNPENTEAHESKDADLAAVHKSIHDELVSIAKRAADAGIPTLFSLNAIDNRSLTLMINGPGEFVKQTVFHINKNCR